MAYWDTSCLLKLYVVEPDSAQFRGYVAGGGSVVTCDFGRLELWAALRRKESLGELLPGGARRALDVFDRDVAAGLASVVAWTQRGAGKFEDIIEVCHARLLPLHTLDGIHEAAAALSEESEIISTDHRVREAALIQGLKLYPP